MTFDRLRRTAETRPHKFIRFVLPNGNTIPRHAHLTEVGHVVKNFIDCGGQTGREEKIVLQTHVGDDIDHRLRSDRFAGILKLGATVVSNPDLDVEVEYDCCLVSQYPVVGAEANSEHLDVILRNGRTQCCARERREAEATSPCCATAVEMDLTDIYQCLCDRTRLRILHLLTRTSLCVCHFQKILQEPQVKISKHLAYLRGRKMVATDREQNWMIHSLPAEPPPALRKNLKCLQNCARFEKIFAQDLQRLERLRQTCCEPRRLFRTTGVTKTRDGKAKRSPHLRS